MSDEVKEPTAGTPPDVSALQAEIEKLKADVEKYKNDYLYLRADFDNYKKSVIKERSDMVKYGGERIFVELLEISDNFDRALGFEVKPENVDSFTKGVKLIGDELRGFFGKFGVVELPTKGVKFDPNIHNALGTEPSSTVPPGHISQVLKKPFKLHDRVIRPAQVIIAVEPKQ